MRILDEDNDQSRDRVTLYLERSEAQQLVGYFDDLLDKGHPHSARAKFSDTIAPRRHAGPLR